MSKIKRQHYVSVASLLKFQFNEAILEVIV